MANNDNIILSEEDRKKLDGIVQKMQQSGVSDDLIFKAVADFKSKYGVKKKEDTASPSLGGGSNGTNSSADPASKVSKVTKSAQPDGPPKPLSIPGGKLTPGANPLAGFDSSKLTKTGDKFDDPYEEKVTPQKVTTKVNQAKSIASQNTEDIEDWVEAKDTKLDEAEFESFLDDDYKQEFSLLKSVKSEDDKIASLEAQYAKTGDATLKAQIDQAKATKSIQQAKYDVYKQTVNKKIDAEINGLKSQLAGAGEEEKKDIQSKIDKLNKKKGYFFKSNDERITDVYTDVAPEMNKFQVPGNTPEEKLQNYAKLLRVRAQKIYDEYAGRGGDIGQAFTTLSNYQYLANKSKKDASAVDAAKEAFGFGKYSDDEIMKKQQELVDIDRQLKLMAPVLLINRAPEIEETGSLGRFGKSFARGLLGTQVQGALPLEEEQASSLLGAINEAGVQDDVNDIVTKVTEQQATPPKALSLEGLSGMAGSSLSVVPSIILAETGLGMARGIRGIGILADALASTKYGKYIVSHSRYTAPTLERAVLANAVKGGAVAEVAGRISPKGSTASEDLDFMTGMFGALGGQAFEKVANKLVISEVANKVVSKMFGAAAPEAKKLIATASKKVGSAAGETVEEYGESLGSLVSLYAQTGDFSQVKKEFMDQFGTLEKNEEFALSSFMLGLFMSRSGLGKASMDLYKKSKSIMSPSAQAKMERFENQVTNDAFNAEVVAKAQEIASNPDAANYTPVTSADIDKKDAAIQLIQDQKSTPEQKVAAAKIVQEIEGKQRTEQIIKSAQTLMSGGETLHAPTEGETFIANPEGKGAIEKYTFRDGQWGTISKDGSYEPAPAEQQQVIQQKYDAQSTERVSTQVQVGDQAVNTEPVQEAVPVERDVKAFEKQVSQTEGILKSASETTKKKLGTMANAVKIVAKELGLNLEGKKDTVAMAEAYQESLAIPEDQRTKAQKALIKVVEETKREGAAERVAKSLAETGIKVKFVSDQEMKKAEGSSGRTGQKGAEGVFMSSDGTILINKENFQAGWGDTVVWHEGTHPVLNIVRNTNPKLYKAAVEGIRQLARLSPGTAIAGGAEWANKGDYKGSETIDDEMLTETIARVASGKINLDVIPRSTKQAIIDFINEISKALGLGRVLSDVDDVQAFKNLAKDISEALTKGKSVAKVVGKGNVKAFENKAETAQKSAVRVMQGKEKMSKYGLKGDKNKTREVGEALEARQREKYGLIDKNDRSPEARKKISSWMMEEIEYFMEAMGENSGKDWYGEKYQKGLDAMAEIFPEMKKDKNARDLFTMLVAITSDGEKVLSNFRLAALAYSEYKKSGNKSLPSKLPGMRQASFSANLAKINSLLEQYKGNIQAIKKDLLKTKPIREINAERSKSGLPGLKTEWPVDFNAPFAASVFGPKLGMFYSNLSGQEDYPTLDRWWSRTFNRYRGTVIPEIKRGFNTKGEPLGIDRVKALLKKPKMSDDNAMIAIINKRDSYAAKGFKNGTELEKAANTVYKAAFENLNDSPANKSDRQFMYDSVSDAVKRLNAKGYDLTIADAQAILWYFEKNLYKTLGVQAKIEGISYEDAAKITVQKFKENNSLNYKIKESEDAAQIEEEDDNIENTEESIQKSNAPREDLAISKKEATFAPDETRTTEKSSTGKVSFAERVGKPVGPDALQVGKRGVEERGFTKTDLNKSFRIGGRSVNVKASLKVQSSVREGIKKAIPNAYVDKELLEITGDPDSFHKFISDVKAAHPSGAAVYVYPKEEYADMRLFITPDGKTGLAIKPNGDLVSAFSEYNTGANKKSNRLAQLMVLGVKAGAKKADAFDTVLPDYYSKFGFRVVARVPFSWDAAPEAYTDEYGTSHKAWQKEDFKGFNKGEPDVVMLVYDGGDRATIQNRVGEFEPYSLYKDNLPESSYDEAVELQDKALSGDIQKSQGGREEIATIDGVQKRVKPLPGGIDIVNGFYSPIEKRVVEFKQPKASVNKWKEIIGVKSDEAVYSGMADWLNSMKPDQQISKEEVQQFMKDNRVEIKEVVKGLEKPKIYERAGKFVIIVGPGQELVYPTREKAEANVFRGQKDTKYEGYTLPGKKEDYKETLVVKPSQEDAVRAEMQKKYPNWGIQSYKDVFSPEDIKKFEKARETKPYKSGHWNEENILVHTRTDVRYDANGDKVLFIEEVQSDWGQEGKREGFSNATEREVRSLKQDEEALYNELENTPLSREYYRNLAITKESNVYFNPDKKIWLKGEVGDEVADKGDQDENTRRAMDWLEGSYYARQAKKAKLKEIQKKLEGMNASGPSTSPYVTDTNSWTKLGLKIALKQAVDAGAKKIAWTTGEQQIKRFDLRKQVDTISYSRNPDGKYDVTASKEGRTVSNPLRSATLKDIERALGKDIAKRIEAGEGSPSKSKFMQKDLTGDQLSVGGQGMIGYYGNQETPGILGSVAKALVKELTGVSPEISQTQIAASDDPFVKYPALGRGSDLVSQPSLEITPELEESVKQGMPQFSKGGREEVISKLSKAKDSNREEYGKAVALSVVAKAEEISNKKDYLNCDSFCHKLVNDRLFKEEFEKVPIKYKPEIGKMLENDQEIEAYREMAKILSSTLKEGDILAFGETSGGRNIGHYGTYIGGGKVIEVEEWGAKPKENTVEKNLQMYGNVPFVYRDKDENIISEVADMYKSSKANGTNSDLVKVVDSVVGSVSQASKGGREGVKVVKGKDFDFDGEYEVMYKGTNIGSMYYDRWGKAWKNPNFNKDKEKPYTAKWIYGDILGDTKDEAINTLVQRHLDAESAPEKSEPLKNFSPDPILNEYLNGLSKIGDLQRNPLNPREFIYNNEASIEINRFDKGNRKEISLQDIMVFEKGAGKGKKTLSDITSVADKLGLKITLEAKPFGNGGLGMRDLVKYYEKAGFKVDLSEYGGEFNTASDMVSYAEKYNEGVPMYREPSGAQASKGGREPLILRHGGEVKIDKFDPSKIKGGFRGELGVGYYFSGDSKYKDYGKETTSIDASSLNLIDENDTFPGGLITKLEKWSDSLPEASFGIGKKDIAKDYIRSIKKVVENNPTTSFNDVRRTVNWNYPQDRDALWSEMMAAVGIDGMKATEFGGIGEPSIRQAVLYPQEKLDSLIVSEPQFSKGNREPIKETFSQAYNLYNQIQQTEGASKKRSLAEQRRAILDANPTAKYIDDNIKTILDQLESNKVATRKGNCP